MKSVITSYSIHYTKLYDMAELKVGVQHTKIDNPTLQERLRSTTTFDFQEKIQMNVSGTIGERLTLGINYNTEATFDFENQVNIEYEGGEDLAFLDFYQVHWYPWQIPWWEPPYTEKGTADYFEINDRPIIIGETEGSDVDVVITSYSIHYTKLYDSPLYFFKESAAHK